MDVQASQTRRQLLAALDRERSPAQRAILERTITTVGAQETVKEHFPELWLAVDVALSVCASLLLADNVNPVAVVYVGIPSSGKTTVVNMFADHSLTYVSDSFTPASFVSNAANVSSEQLKNVDLLPRIRHKVLITPELASTFRGKEDELAKRFAILTRVLDGQGYTTDSGTHGQRGYRGDFLFAWLGCTTPLESKVWRIMAQLGSRLFFLEVGDQEEQQDLQSLVNLLRASHDGLPYNKRVDACKAIIHRLLTALYAERGVRGVEWDDAQDPPLVQESLMRLAVLLAFMRSAPASENEEQAVEKESPQRAYAVLRHIARGHALVHGRQQLLYDDLRPVAQVVVSTMPRDYGRVFRALVQKKELTVAQVKEVLGVKDPQTARKVMTALDRLGIVTFEQPGVGKASSIYFTPEWGWCREGQCQGLFLRQEGDEMMEDSNL